jgi:hypothetical protein
VSLVLVGSSTGIGSPATIALPAGTVEGDLILLAITNAADLTDPRLTNVQSGTGLYYGISDGNLAPVTVTFGPPGLGDNGYALMVVRGVTALSVPAVTVQTGDIAGTTPIGGVTVPSDAWDAAVAIAAIKSRGVPGGFVIDSTGGWTFGDTAEVTTPFWAPAVFTTDPGQGRIPVPVPVPVSSSSVNDTRFFAIIGLITTPPVTRQFPRDDAYGVVGGPRVYPPTRGGRVVGGQG